MITSNTKYFKIVEKKILIKKFNKESLNLIYQASIGCRSSRPTLRKLSFRPKCDRPFQKLRSDQNRRIGLRPTPSATAISTSSLGCVSAKAFCSERVLKTSALQRRSRFRRFLSLRCWTIS